MSGKKWTEERKLRHSKLMSKENAGYQAVHIHIRKKLGKPIKCSNCGRPQYYSKSGAYQVVWASKSHGFSKDLNDWIPLCMKCNREYDEQFMALRAINRINQRKIEEKKSTTES